MRVLLDTHALLWWLLADPRLSPAACDAIRAPRNEVLVSSASAFELSTKHRLGKLWTGPLEPDGLPELLVAERFAALPITIEHALAAGGLPGPHRDPFDRMLIAQGRVEGVPVVTRDPVFASYGAAVIW